MVSPKENLSLQFCPIILWILGGLQTVFDNYKMAEKMLGRLVPCLKALGNLNTLL